MSSTSSRTTWAPGHRRPRRFGERPTSKILGAFGAVITAVLVAVLAAGGTYARLSSTASVPSSTITAGTAALVVPPTISFGSDALYPGSSTVGSVVVTNSGDVPLALSVTALSGGGSSPLRGDLIVGVGIVPDAASCVVGTFVPVWTGRFASVVTGSIGPTPVSRLGTARVCVSVSLPTNAAAGEQGTMVSGLVVTLGGIQP